MKKMIFCLLTAGIAACTSRDPFMTVTYNKGQMLVSESGKPVLQYNYSIVNEQEALDSTDLNPRHRSGRRLESPNPSIYAVARSNYIHPLYGLKGEMLTRDWSKDHPHHRGIYWAWPEVDFGTRRGDLHALQIVFARPTGRTSDRSTDEFAQLEAENRWMWGDSIPIVRELALIRVYRETPHGRVIDLAFRFDALADSVTLARRDTHLYGGLNIRMQTPRDQKITTHPDSSEVAGGPAWSDLSGVFTGEASTTGLMVMQHRQNPGYPGEWIQYPNLSWCQPTFPAAGTRYPLKKGEPLFLRYRIFVHAGSAPDKVSANALWDEYNELNNNLLIFSLDKK